MAEQKKLVAEITSMDEDFTQWYTDVVIKAGLIAYSHIKGFMVYKPAGYALWEAVQKHLDARFKAVGVENVYLPMMIPENLLSKESDLVNGFAPEVAWVTHGGQEELQERICVRPTSETLFSDFYKASQELQPVVQRCPLGEGDQTFPSLQRVHVAGGTHSPRHYGRGDRENRADA